jgi:hypothetical protein
MKANTMATDPNYFHIALPVKLINPKQLQIFCQIIGQPLGVFTAEALLDKIDSVADSLTAEQQAAVEAMNS